MIRKLLPHKLKLVKRIMSKEKNTNQEKEQDTLLEFPCEFNIKAVGLAEESFELLVVEIVSKHIDELPEKTVATRKSSNGKSLSVTVTFTAISKLQLDTIYIELSGHDRVMMAL